MFVTGFAIFLGLVLVFIKLPRRAMLRLLRHDIALDVAVTVIVLAVHWGTFSGVMAATVAGLLCSIGTTLAKRTFGFIKGDQYFPGIVTLRV
jgi:NhaP-type Na+/H+ or K+/H+ antiporter